MCRAIGGRGVPVRYRWHEQQSRRIELAFAVVLTAQAPKPRVAVRFGRGSDLDVRGKGMVGYTFSGPFAEDMVVSAPAEKVVQSLHLPTAYQCYGTGRADTA